LRPINCKRAARRTPVLLRTHNGHCVYPACHLLRHCAWARGKPIFAGPQARRACIREVSRAWAARDPPPVRFRWSNLRHGGGILRSTVGHRDRDYHFFYHNGVYRTGASNKGRIYPADVRMEW
ncbi:MAG: hypothetical protein HWN66_17390, partial [Candidatus Helarchaeota archaeon]|nr:hypothetical protein [Candidatus Helarchaeota archaeon]